MWAIVPLKSPARAKSRLAGVLDASQRRHLLFALAAGVIRALQATPGITTVAVVTSNTEVAGFARALGARVIRQAIETGTADALLEAAEVLQPLQLPALLMIAGDLPLITPQALQQLLSARSATPGVVLAADRHRRGTNALLCTPPQLLAPCFGEDSLRRHVSAAAQAGIAARVLEIDALAFDLDDAGDLSALRRQADAPAGILMGLDRRSRLALSA